MRTQQAVSEDEWKEQTICVRREQVRYPQWRGETELVDSANVTQNIFLSAAAWELVSKRVPCASSLDDVCPF